MIPLPEDIVTLSSTLAFKRHVKANILFVIVLVIAFCSCFHYGSLSFVYVNLEIAKASCFLAKV